MTGFQMGGGGAVGFFLQRSRQNFDSLDKFFKVADKERALQISVFKGGRKKFEGSDSSHPWRSRCGGGGGGNTDNKWHVSQLPKLSRKTLVTIFSQVVTNCA